MEAFAGLINGLNIMAAAGFAVWFVARLIEVAT